MLKIVNKNKYVRLLCFMPMIVAGTAALLPEARGAAAANEPARDYPNRPIRYILPGGPGSSADVFSRSAPTSRRKPRPTATPSRAAIYRASPSRPMFTKKCPMTR